MSLSCTVNEILSLISKNLKKVMWLWAHTIQGLYQRCTDNRLIIGIDRLLAVLKIIDIGRLVYWYRPIVIYTFGKYKFLLYSVVLLQWQ